MQATGSPSATTSRSPTPPAPLRLLVVTDSVRPPVTGVGRVTLSLLRELSALGHEVHAVDWQPNPVVAAVCPHLHVLPVRGRRLRTARWHFDLLPRVAALGVAHDALLETSGYPNVRGSHPALVTFVYDMSMFARGIYRPGKRAWFRLFHRRGIDRAALVVAISQYTRERLLARSPAAASRCVVVPPGVDSGFAAPDAGAVAAAPSPYFLAVGTIEKRKNIGRLLDAFAAARAGGVGARLVLAGRPGFGAGRWLRRIAGELADAVTVVSGLDDRALQALYRDAVALLFPSLDEGFGLPILEAMQSGTPVLTSDRAAMPEVAGDAALLVDPDDVGAIRDGIERLWRDADLRARLVERGRDRVQCFQPRRAAQQLVEHLRALARPNGGSP